MVEEKKYLLETKCEGLEEHDGESWIGEEELNRIKQRAGSEALGYCERCKLTVKNEQGKVLFVKEGC